MRKLFRIVFVFTLFGIFWLSNISCTKTISRVDHRDTIINVKILPYYSGVSSVLIQNYINKLYIDLLGRIPSSGEAQDQLLYLTSNNLRIGARDTIASGLLIQANFAKRLFAITSSDMIGGVDSGQIASEISLYKYVIYLDSSSGRPLIADKYGLNQLYILQSCAPNYAQHKTTINQFFKACIDNPFYDQINMGTENFVKACFNNLLGRNATVAELAAGENIVNGATDILFLQTGNSKGDFENIICNTPEFYQGLVIKSYATFLNRLPSSNEEATATALLQTTHDYRLTLQNIVSTKEYAGF